MSFGTGMVVENVFAALRKNRGGAAPSGALPGFRQLAAEDYRVRPRRRKAGHIVAAIRTHFRTREKRAFRIGRRRFPYSHHLAGKNEVVVYFRRERAAIRRRHLTMVTVERPEMALFGMLHELRMREQPARVVGGSEVLHAGKV